MSDPETLLQRMRRIASEADATPALSIDLAKAAFGMRDLDGELAELAWDSLSDAGQLAGTRGPSEVRMMSFETPTVGVELQVAERGALRTLLGQIVGIVPSVVSVETDDGATPAELDDLGTFRVEGLPPGRTRVRLSGPDGSTITTSWVTI
jgi:hypothetical protein